MPTGKPYWYITNNKVNSAFHSSGVGKSSTGLSSWDNDGARSHVSGDCNTDPIWQVTLCSFDMGFLWRAIPLSLCHLTSFNHHGELWKIITHMTQQESTFF